MSLLRDLRDARDGGYRWGVELYYDGKLPVDHTAPLPGCEMSRRRRACMESFDKGLFEGYLAAAAADGATTEARA